MDTCYHKPIYVSISPTHLAVLRRRKPGGPELVDVRRVDMRDCRVMCICGMGRFEIDSIGLSGVMWAMIDRCVYGWAYR